MSLVEILEVVGCCVAGVAGVVLGVVNYIRNGRLPERAAMCVSALESSSSPSALESSSSPSALESSSSSSSFVLALNLFPDVFHRPMLSSHVDCLLRYLAVSFPDSFTFTSRYLGPVCEQDGKQCCSCVWKYLVKVSVESPVLKEALLDRLVSVIAECSDEKLVGLFGFAVTFESLEVPE